jgi:hypothetical protein
MDLKNRKGPPFMILKAILKRHQDIQFNQLPLPALWDNLRCHLHNAHSSSATVARVVGLSQAALLKETLPRRTTANRRALNQINYRTTQTTVATKRRHMMLAEAAGLEQQSRWMMVEATSLQIQTLW